MIVFEVSLNGKVLTRAGAENLGVLTTIITAVGHLGTKSHWGEKRKSEDLHFHLHVGGRTKRESGDDEDFVWSSGQKVHPDDVITVKVLEADVADAHDNEGRDV